MKRRRVLFAGVLAFGVLVPAAIVASPALASSDKVEVCYVSRDEPNVERNIQVVSHLVDGLLQASLSYRGVCASYGESATLGNGGLKVFSQSKGAVPVAIGVAFPRTTLDGLPYHPPTDGAWCYDMDGNGTIDDHMECVGGYGNALHFSNAFRSTVDSRFQYMLVNWNPSGHPPEGIYDAPHFDLHFYITPNSERLGINVGPCPVLVDCDDYATGTQPVPPQYMAADYFDPGVVEAGMGNHLVDITSPEYYGEPFTKTFIYGSFGGKITFYEPMVTRDYFNQIANGAVASQCYDLKLPQAWQVAGWYPTQYCLRYRANRQELTATLEGFVYRMAG